MSKEISDRVHRALQDIKRVGVKDTSLPNTSPSDPIIVVMGQKPVRINDDRTIYYEIGEDGTSKIMLAEGGQGGGNLYVAELDRADKFSERGRCDNKILIETRGSSGVGGSQTALEILEKHLATKLKQQQCKYSLSDVTAVAVAAFSIGMAVGGGFVARYMAGSSQGVLSTDL